MSQSKIYNNFLQLKHHQKVGFAVLIDPDSATPHEMLAIAERCNQYQVDFIFVGGSLMTTQHVDECIKSFKSMSNIPVILFPGHPTQVSKEADALFFLSLISGRNPDLLIGQHVVAAPMIKASKLEVIPTGYLVVDGGVPTTVSYMSNAAPIPANKPDIALCTAWAGELLGLKLMYMDAGSGAKQPISKEMIEKVAQNIDAPLIVGGGMRNETHIKDACAAGAQVIVVGNAIEKDPAFLQRAAELIKKHNNAHNSSVCTQ